MPGPNSPKNDDLDDSDALFRSVYDELHRLARLQMAGQPACHTLQPTALVNEAYLRLSEYDEAVTTRLHFVRLAARAMRQILVDHGRRKNAEKRVPSDRRVELTAVLDGAVATFDERAHGLEDLEEALVRLEEVDPDLAELVELHFFGGQTIAACAEVLEISERQAFRRWRSARAFLAREMQASGAPDATADSGASDEAEGDGP